MVHSLVPNVEWRHLLTEVNVSSFAASSLAVACIIILSIVTVVTVAAQLAFDKRSVLQTTLKPSLWYWRCLRRRLCSFKCWISESIGRCEHKVLVLGLDNAGKSSLCHLLENSRGWPTRQPRPQHHVLQYETATSAFSTQSAMHLVDPCGDWPRSRTLWESLLKGKPAAVVFVVDSADIDRLGAARESLCWTLQQPAAHSLPILVLGNKVDMHSALETWDFKRQMGLTGLSCEQRAALVAPSSHHSSLPNELRRRIASFHPDEASTEPRKAALDTMMCCLRKEDSCRAVHEWLRAHIPRSEKPSNSFATLMSAGSGKLWRNACRMFPCIECVCQELHKPSSTSRQAFALPLYHA